jgi:large subunit ribosomal protein L3
MSGHYGHETVTIQNLVVLDAVLKRNVLLILGAIPGPAGSIVTIKSSSKMPNKKLEYTIITKEIQEEILKQNEALEDKEALHEANLEAEAEAKKVAEKEAAEKAAEAIAREKEKEVAEKNAKAAATSNTTEKK